MGAIVTCQRCGYNRQPSDDAPDWQCPACGIAYIKADAAKPTHQEIRVAAQRRLQEEMDRNARLEATLAKAHKEELDPTPASYHRHSAVIDDDGFAGLVTPTLAPWVFWLGAFSSFLAGVACFLSDLFLYSVLFWLVLPISLRISTETIVVLFRIHSDIRAIRQHLTSKTDRQ